MEEQDPIGECSNCQAKLPESKLNTHEPYCRRNNVRCPKCKQIVHKNEMEEHIEEAHKKVNCKNCSMEFEENSLAVHEAVCPMRPKRCNFCTLSISPADYPGHIYVCGSRTRNCQICQKPIQLRDIEYHESTCTGIIDIKPSSGSPSAEFNYGNEMWGNNRLETKGGYESYLRNVRGEEQKKFEKMEEEIPPKTRGVPEQKSNNARDLRGFTSGVPSIPRGEDLNSRSAITRGTSEKTGEDKSKPSYGVGRSSQERPGAAGSGASKDEAWNKVGLGMRSSLETRPYVSNEPSSSYSKSGIGTSSKGSYGQETDKRGTETGKKEERKPYGKEPDNKESGIRSTGIGSSHNKGSPAAFGRDIDNQTTLKGNTKKKNKDEIDFEMALALEKESVRNRRPEPSGNTGDFFRPDPKIMVYPTPPSSVPDFPRNEDDEDEMLQRILEESSRTGHKPSHSSGRANKSGSGSTGQRSFNPEDFGGYGAGLGISGGTGSGGSGAGYNTGIDEDEELQRAIEASMKFS